MANKGTKLAYLAGAAVGLWLIAKKKQESLESDPDHVLVENTGEERDTNSASNYVSVGAVGGRMELGVEQNDLNDIILFAQNGMYNKILLEIAMGFDAADVSGHNLFKDSLKYFENLYETYPDDEGMTPAEEKERESMLNSMLLMAYLAFPTDEVKLVDEYLKRATGIGGVFRLTTGQPDGVIYFDGKITNIADLSFDELIRYIEECTDNNDHWTAREAAAYWCAQQIYGESEDKFLKFLDFATAMQYLEQEHSRMNNLTPNLQKARNVFSQLLYTLIYEDFGKSVADRIWRAF